ncbi:MAG: DUF1223 domain-containing protein [Acidobacteriota bacterium]|nr:DUF1223 domain-containing protein [Acidobacteriota bacterium]
MEVHSLAVGLFSVGLALVAVTATAVTSESTSAQLEKEPAPSAVLVELFTSQGCSSCPAADRLLSRLAKTLPRGTSIVPLAFHVDYWNYLGWTDPFSSSDWSDRQRSYARRLESRGVYTPQIVVNGRWGAVGSVESDVTALIEHARQDEERSRITIAARLAPDDRIEIELSVQTHRSKEELVLWLAVVENGFETPVGRGENIRKTLHNDHVVRRLLPALELGTIGSGVNSILINPDPDWRRDNLSFAAFVQDRATLRVYAAASTRLGDE